MTAAIPTYVIHIVDTIVFDDLWSSDSSAIKAGWTRRQHWVAYVASPIDAIWGGGMTYTEVAMIPHMVYTII